MSRKERVPSMSTVQLGMKMKRTHPVSAAGARESTPRASFYAGSPFSVNHCPYSVKFHVKFHDTSKD